MDNHVEFVVDDHGIYKVKWHGPNGGTVFDRDKLIKPEEIGDTNISGLTLDFIIMLLRKTGTWVVSTQNHAPEGKNVTRSE